WRRARRLVGGRRVGGDGGGGFGGAELEDVLLVRRVDGHRVAPPAVPQDLLAALAAFAPVLHDVIREDRAELFNRQRVVASDTFQGRQQHAGRRRHGQAAFLRNVNRRLP